GPGEIIGTETLFNKENHIATAEVISEGAHVGFLERNNFFEFMNDNPALLFDFAKHLSTKSMAYKLKLVESSYYGSKQRISRLILAGNDSDLTLSRAKLAYLSGVSYKTTIQVLSALENRQLIETDNHSITVKDEKGLSKLANHFPLDLEDEGLL
ncbi:Crp/Fnr family transcriptional regulator, partial [Candidatus Bipolaricaulota bacterium]|nr:Crp/Fnr family transcriptional regulator [Candidatus Bipolaricaulota bacterium]